MTSSYDQARRLRELVREARCQQGPSSRSPSVVAVSGGCTADLVASVAAQLADELARQTVKVMFCKAGMLAQARHADFDIALIDAGVGFTPASAPVWREADLVLAVVSSSRESLIATYTTVKSALLDLPLSPVHVVPSQCADEHEAENLHRRISESCKRFLDCTVQAAPWLPCKDISGSDLVYLEAIRRLAEYVRGKVLAPAMAREVLLAGSDGVEPHLLHFS